MKKFVYNLLIGASVLMSASCMKVDNWDAPDAHIYGNIIDVTTNKNILASQGECKIRFYEMSYNENPSPQNIPLKQDGSYNNTKWFNGTYDVEPLGAWWPVERQSITLDGSLQHDFKVTPYLQVTDLTHSLDGKYLNISCRIKAPIEEGLPKVMEVRPYVSMNKFCGSNQCISKYVERGNGGQDKENYCKRLVKSWNDIKQADGYSPFYNFKLEMKPGYKYYVRVGAQVNDAYRNYNYSEIFEVEVPADAK